MRKVPSYIEEWRLPEFARSIRAGSLHERMAQTGEAGRDARYSADDAFIRAGEALLPPGETERVLPGGVVLRRGATGVVSWGCGDIRERMNATPPAGAE